MRRAVASEGREGATGPAGPSQGASPRRGARAAWRVGVAGVDGESRRLIFVDPRRASALLLLKPADVPAYVTLRRGRPRDRGPGHPAGAGPRRLRAPRSRLRLLPSGGGGAARALERDDPTSGRGCGWPRITHVDGAILFARGIQVEIVRLDGSIELAPLVGLADRIVDLVQSGETLRANGLVEVAEITRSTARLIANRASHEDEVSLAVTRPGRNELRALVLRPRF